MGQRGYMISIGVVLFLLAVGCVLGLPLCFTTSCTPQARSEADAIALELTGMVCSPSDPFDGNIIVEIVCVAAEGAEKVAGILLDGGADFVAVKSVKLRVTKPQADRLLRRHGRHACEAGIDGSQP